MNNVIVSMQRHITHSDLAEFVVRAWRTNIVYYRNRRELWEFLVLRISDPAPGLIELGSEDLLSMRTFLQARNDSLTDDKRLSFDRALLSFERALERRRVSSSAGVTPTSPSEEEVPTA